MSVKYRLFCLATAKAKRVYYVRLISFCDRTPCSSEAAKPAILRLFLCLGERLRDENKLNFNNQTKEH